MTHYVTATGYELEIGSVDRRELDQFLTRDPEPEPPIREVEAWGGEVEKLPDLDDPDFQAAMSEWRIRLFVVELDMVAGAIQIVEAPEGDLEALEMVLQHEPDEIDVLRFAALTDERDRDNVVGEVLYLSTTTERGIREAAERFAVVWSGKPVLDWRLGGAPATHSRLFEDWAAAVGCNYTWDSFCALPGPRQSEIVAFWRLRTRLDYLRARG